ncbi:hypothetical protein QNH46_21095 [Paenibacillus woosongensis]|uniref:Uncharacterized protein n=1 Tax=Paenibacillus woosongensis TaxID=307580 RepID=A0AA95L1G4_9BACL|nr:hypothetical protein [Paenibacillus woosongensis]WHX48536.1 hypothetical protein QNH46_21095 [Paenibacillus woosongensis]
MNIMVGSIESSDLLLEFTDQNQGVYISNLVPEIDNELIEQVVISFLKEFNLVRFNPKVYYNGANQWVIKGRCEAAALLVAAATAIKEEEGGTIR